MASLRRRYALFAAAVLVLTLALIAVGLWARDTWQDRRHSISIVAPTPLFAGSGNDGCGVNQIGVIQTGNTVRVQRIRYWKSCATIDVAVSDGRKGYVVLGQGAVEVNPTLP